MCGGDCVYIAGSDTRHNSLISPLDTKPLGPPQMVLARAGTAAVPGIPGPG